MKTMFLQIDHVAVLRNPDAGSGELGRDDAVPRLRVLQKSPRSMDGPLGLETNRRIAVADNL